MAADRRRQLLRQYAAASDEAGRARILNELLALLTPAELAVGRERLLEWLAEEDVRAAQEESYAHLHPPGAAPPTFPPFDLPFLNAPLYESTFSGDLVGAIYEPGPVDPLWSRRVAWSVEIAGSSVVIPLRLLPQTHDFASKRELLRTTGAGYNISVQAELGDANTFLLTVEVSAEVGITVTRQSGPAMQQTGATASFTLPVGDLDGLTITIGGK